MAFDIKITKRIRKRTLKSGDQVRQTRYVVNFKDPRTRKRTQLFFERQKDAVEKRNELLTAIEMGKYNKSRRDITVREIVEHWLENRTGEIKARTLAGYQFYARHIIGPILIGTTEQRTEYALTNQLPLGTSLQPMLGDRMVHELTTAEIRDWHRTLSNEVGVYSAKRAKSFLATAMALAAEDFGIHPPPMPVNLGRSASKPKKEILTPDQVRILLNNASGDKERGVYYAFPFLTGTRPSEQLGLLWEDVNFEEDVIHIRRMQELDGSASEMTKTTASTRDIPMCPMLRQMLLEWRVACPRFEGVLYRVFPGLGRLQPWPKKRKGGGGPLLYHNFRKRFWRKALDELNLPYVTPHSARHCFISTLQAQGVEVGLVAKLAGHANATVTLSHYTQAVRGGGEAVEKLERAYKNSA